jgi:hypothetical protein
LDVEQDLGSTEGLYSDPGLPLAERATPLLVDVLGRVHEELLEEAFSGGGDVGALEGVLDHFSEVLVAQDIELTETKASAAAESAGAEAAVGLAVATG